MKIHFPSFALCFILCAALLSVSLLLVGCEMLGNSEDDSNDSDDTGEPLDIDGLYGGYLEETDAADGSVQRLTVWTMQVSGDTLEFDALGPGGSFEATGTVDETTGAFSISKSFTTPSVLTIVFSGTIAEDDTLSGVGTIDTDTDGTVDTNVVLDGQENTDGYIVRGTMTYPESDGAQDGKPYTVLVDPDGDGDNGGVVGYYMGVAGASTGMCYLMTNVPEGRWEIYGVLYTNAPDSTNPERAPESDEYSENYGSQVLINDSDGVYNFDLGEHVSP